MNTSKLLSLVAPLLLGAATLFGAEVSTFRNWTDLQGRSLQARLLAPPADGSIKIERADGKVFDLRVERLSTADQDYLRTLAPQPEAAATTEAVDSLRPLTEKDWEMVAQLLSLTPRTYADIPAEEVVETLNKRLASSDFRLPDGRPITIRLEGEAAEARINTEIRYVVNLATFLQGLAKSSQLELRLDANQQLVLLASSTASSGKDKIKLFGL